MSAAPSADSRNVRERSRARLGAKFEYLKAQGIALFPQDGSGITSADQRLDIETAKLNDIDPQAWLANTLGRFGIPFLAGEIILSGSLAPLLPAAPGDRFDMSLTGIGTASIAFEA